jgi:hypothetical protein
MNEPAPSKGTSIAITIPDRGGKYLYEDMAYILCLSALCALCGLTCWVNFMPLGLMTTTASIAFGMWIVKSMKAGHAERRRVLADPLPQLIVDADGINGSVLMLEGQRRDTMDKDGDTRFKLAWDNINSVEFNTAHGRGGSPYMVIVPKDVFERTDYYFLSREALWGKEKAIADKAREHGIHVSVEDTLR